MTPISAEPIRLLLAEFEDIISRGLCAVIEEDSRLRLVASDVNHEQLTAMLADCAADVAVVNFGSLSSPTELRDLHTAAPHTRLVLLADHLSEADCRQLMAFGAGACLPKSADARELLDAVCSGSNGHHSTTPPGAEAAGRGRLTRSEVEVLELLRSGRSNAEIAATLHVGFETVRTHTSSIYRKLGVSCRRELRSRDVAPAHHGSP
jgi:DNA-binding NarL/FixJ family response regulator